MIQSFRNKRLEDFFINGTTKGLQVEHVTRLEDILNLLDAAHTISDMNFPGSFLHKLEPKAENRWAVRVSKNWRVTFVFENGDASEVDYLDYH
jgi:proteic killer suppression protein